MLQISLPQPALIIYIKYNQPNPIIEDLVDYKFDEGLSYFLIIVGSVSVNVKVPGT